MLKRKKIIILTVCASLLILSVIIAIYITGLSSDKKNSSSNSNISSGEQIPDNNIILQKSEEILNEYFRGAIDGASFSELKIPFAINKDEISSIEENYNAIKEQWQVEKSEGGSYSFNAHITNLKLKDGIQNQYKINFTYTYERNYTKLNGKVEKSIIGKYEVGEVSFQLVQHNGEWTVEKISPITFSIEL